VKRRKADGANKHLTRGLVNLQHHHQTDEPIFLGEKPWKRVQINFGRRLKFPLWITKCLLNTIVIKPPRTAAEETQLGTNQSTGRPIYLATFLPSKLVLKPRIGICSLGMVQFSSTKLPKRVIIKSKNKEARSSSTKSNGRDALGRSK